MRNMLMMATAALMLVGCGVYSNGERTGVVNKLSHKGLLCKTYEGEMLLGGLKNERVSLGTDSEGFSQSATIPVANVFEFSVKDEAVVEQIKTAQRSGDVVTLTYEEFILPDICGRATGYLITKVTT